MGTTYNPAIVTDGLVLCLDAANKRSYPGTGTTWSDLAGSNDGAMQNMTASNFSSNNGGVLSFDGTNEHVNFGNLESLSNISVQMNVRVLSNPGTFRSFIGSRQIGVNDHYSGIVIDMRGDSTANFSVCSVEGSFVQSSSDMMISSVDFGVWCNICVTVSSSTVTMYLNGLEESSLARTNYYSSTISMQDLQIGRRPYQGGTHNMRINADMSNVSIYNRAITSGEVRQNFESTAGRYI